MCGLNGVAGHLDIKARDAFNQMFIANFFRGQAASGVAGPGAGEVGG